MNTTQKIMRGAALLGALVLFTGYIYERSGGRLLEKLGAVEAASPGTAPPGTAPPGNTVSVTDLTMFAGSKSAAAFDPQQTPAEVNLLPGSKSLIIVDHVPRSGEAAQLLPGSKYILIDFPTQSAPSPSARSQSAPSRSAPNLQQQQSRP